MDGDDSDSDGAGCWGCLGFLGKPFNRSDSFLDEERESMLGGEWDGHNGYSGHGYRKPAPLAGVNRAICREFPVKETTKLVRTEDTYGQKMINEYVRECNIGRGSYGKVVLYRSNNDGKPLILLSLIAASSSFHLGGDESAIVMATLGGVRDSSPASANSLETDELARFAVAEHNKKQNSLLEFARVVKAKEQVVAGTLYHLTVEAIDAGKKKLYEAKVWVKPWANFKELQEFNHVGDADDAAGAGAGPAFTASDLGAKRDGHEPGWRMVPAHDPVVQDAANHAVKTIQQRSNSLAAYELVEIVHAKAEVTEDKAKFDMLLKTKRGSKEEKFKVEVHKNLEGTFHLNQMEQDHSE